MARELRMEHASIDVKGTVKDDAIDCCESPPKQLSFQQIADLVAQGKPVPGIKQIPLHLHAADKVSHSHIQRPKKPWEQK